MAAADHFTGWLPQPEDPRDHIYSPVKAADKQKVDLSTLDARFDQPYNQQFLGSCVANAVAAALRIGENAKYPIKWHVMYDASRLWLYWCGRLITAVGESVSATDVSKFLDYLNNDGPEGSFPRAGQEPKEFWRLRYEMMEDKGTHERDVIRALPYLGICPDDKWSYKQVDAFLTTFGDNAKLYKAADLSQWYRNDPKRYYTPTQDHLRAAADFMDQGLKFSRIRDLNEPVTGPNPSNTALVSEMEAAICEGFPVIVALRYAKSPGFTTVTQPQYLFEPVGAKYFTDIAGHCVLCIGYDRNQRKFKFLNSWGNKWGEKGYFYVPYRYFEPNTGSFQSIFQQQGKADVTYWYTFADDLWVIKISNAQKRP